LAVEARENPCAERRKNKAGARGREKKSEIDLLSWVMYFFP